MALKESIKKFLGMSEPKLEDLNKRIDERILEAKERRGKKVTSAISEKGKEKTVKKEVKKKVVKKEVKKKPAKKAKKKK